MKVQRLTSVTAAVAGNIEAGKPTDVYKLAAELQQQFPDLCPKELVKLIEAAVTTLRGSAIWERPDQLP